MLKVAITRSCILHGEPDNGSAIMREFPEEAALFRHRLHSNPTVSYTNDGRRIINGQLVDPPEEPEQMWGGLIKRTISKKLTNCTSRGANPADHKKHSAPIVPILSRSNNAINDAQQAALSSSTEASSSSRHDDVHIPTDRPSCVQDRETEHTDVQKKNME